MTEPENLNVNGESTDELLARLREGLNSDQIKSVVQFLADIPNELSTKDLLRLINVDIEFQRSNGKSVQLADYIEDIPELASIANKQTLTLPQLNETTAAFTEVLEPPVLEPPIGESRRNKRQLVQVGDTIDDFELLAELGKGSFATVFLARQTSMQRLVALKVSVDHGMEAQTLAQLDHPHIVRVFDQRRAAKHNLQLLYMQYLEGGTLLDVLRQIADVPEQELGGKHFVQIVDQAMNARGASPSHQSLARKNFLESDWEQTICRIGYNLARALDYAHQKGVLHRDIKPANVLIGNDYSVKLADFNISAAESVVGDGKFGGSLAYMSPEQIRAFNLDDDFSPSQLDHQCDIYSLGVMLYQLLTKELPFFAFTKSKSTDGLSTMVAERERSFERIESSLKNRSPLIRSALVRCLQPEKENRPESARDLANQLKVGSDREAESFLFPQLNNWTSYLQRHFYIVSISVLFVFNLMGAIFVREFNLMDSVPEESKSQFGTIVVIVNRIVFPAAVVMFIVATTMVSKALKLSLENRSTEIPDSTLAMHKTLSVGHLQAIICGSFWLFAGMLYPVILTLLGSDLKRSDWVDFITSHTLTGIAITALTFFATTYLALKIWLPVLLKNSFSESVLDTVNSGLSQLIRKIPIYQMFAVSVPLLAIALLVIYKELMTGSENALKVISIFGLFTIPVVMISGNRIRAICEKLLVVLRSET